MRFEFATASRVIFGPGTLDEVPALAGALGQRALVVTGRTTDRAAHLLALLESQPIETQSFGISGEPTIDMVLSGLERARESAADLVIGIGGGSALDAGKAIAALLTNGGEPLDYLEVIGRGQPLTRPSAPLIAVPTTAGTGAEVTRNAVLGSPEHKVKVSMRSPGMLPRVAVIDPQLTHSMPPTVTASTGLDALTQCLEPFVSHKANPLTDAVCRTGLGRCGRSLQRAYETGDPAAREDMALASLFGGLALTNAKLGAVHGFAGPLGGMYPAPHGAVCARLLPFVMEANIRALQGREPDNPALARYTEAARLLTGNPEAGVSEGVRWVQELCAALAVPPLAEYGITAADFPAIVEQSQKASSMQGNPIRLRDDELTEILRLAC